MQKIHRDKVCCELTARLIRLSAVSSCGILIAVLMYGEIIINDREFQDHKNP